MEHAACMASSRRTGSVSLMIRDLIPLGLAEVHRVLPAEMIWLAMQVEAQNLQGIKLLNK